MQSWCNGVVFFWLLPTVLLDAGSIELPFNPNEAIRYIDRYRGASTIREGEFLIDTNIVYVEAAGYNFFPAASFDGTNYFIVWQDTRSGESKDIYGARVTQSGTVLDLGGIPICTAFGEQRDPAVAFNGTNYVVVWMDRRSGSFDIWGARVTPSGVVLDSIGFPIAVGSYDNWTPAVGSDGTNNLVVWEDCRSSYADIYGARVSPSGVVFDTNGFVISDAVFGQAQPSLAFDGSNYLVVWLDDRNWSDYNIYGARVTPSGSLIDTNGVPISTAPGDQYNPCAAFDGTNYLVVWGAGDIYGTRVTTSVEVLDPQGIPISVAYGYQHYTAIDFDGTNYLVVWQDHRNGTSCPEVYGTRINQEGSILDPNGIQISVPYWDNCRPTIAFGGLNYLVAWYYYQEGGSLYDIYATRVSQSSSILDSSGLLISTAAFGQYDPCIAYDGTNHLVIWEDKRKDPYSDIYGARISKTGTIVDQSSIPVCTTAHEQKEPAVVFGGGNYLAVWEDNRGYKNIYGARILPSGIVLDSDGIPISTAGGEQTYPSVAFDGTNYFVVWLDRRFGSRSSIFGARVSSLGLVLDTAGIMVDTTGFSPGPPALGFDGVNYLVVWSAYPGVGPPRDLYGIRVSQSGVALDPAPFVITNAIGHQVSPVIDFDGTNYLIVWEDWRYYQDSADIYGARVDTSGLVLDPNGLIITSASRHQGSPAVDFDGKDYSVVWEDKRNGSYYDIYGAKLDTSGYVIDTFVLSTQAGHQRMPTLAVETTDQVLVAYSSWTSYINHCPAHTFRIWGKFHPFVGIDEEDTYATQSIGVNLWIHPNPTRAKCSILYTLPADSEVTIAVFDVTGRVVQEIVSGRQHAGTYRKTVEMSNFAQGIYFVRIESQNGSAVEKITLVR